MNVVIYNDASGYGSWPEDLTRTKLYPGKAGENARVSQKADRGRPASRSHQQRSRPREVHPSRTPLYVAPVVGAAPSGSLPGSALRPDGGRSFQPAQRVPD